MRFPGIPEGVKKLVADNATILLTAGGVVGTITTAVLAGRAGFKAAEILQTAKFDYDEEKDEVIEHELDKLTRVKLVGLQFVPPVLTGGVTIAAIIFSHKMSAQKAAALAAAYGLSEKSLREYKEKVQEKLTGPKAQAIDDELAQDRVDRTPGGNNLVIVEGEVLCFDEPTGRYFKSSMENIRKAVNDTNEEIIHTGHADANAFYEKLGMDPTTWTGDVGWNTDQLIDIKYTSVLKDGKPCISIDFRYLPKADFISKNY